MEGKKNKGQGHQKLRSLWCLPKFT